MTAMLSTLLSWTVLTVLGQAPVETGWLKALPAETEVVVHVRGVSATRDDAIAMLKAMSPVLAEQAQSALNMAVDQMKDQFGPKSITSPFIVAFRLPKPDELQSHPPFAVIVETSNYDG